MIVRSNERRVVYPVESFGEENELSVHCMHKQLGHFG
jgi:hypothetical protein